MWDNAGGFHYLHYLFNMLSWTKATIMYGAALKDQKSTITCRQIINRSSMETVVVGVDANLAVSQKREMVKTGPFLFA